VDIARVFDSIDDMNTSPRTYPKGAFTRFLTREHIPLSVLTAHSKVNESVTWIKGILVVSFSVENHLVWATK
jgi:hypothetical protein